MRQLSSPWLFLSLFGFLVLLGFVMLGLAVYRIHGRNGFLTRFAAYFCVSLVGAFFSFSFLAIGGRFVLSFIHWDSSVIDKFFGRELSAIIDAPSLLTMGICVGAVYLGIFFGAFLVWCWARDEK